MKRLTYAGKSAATWSNKYLYEILEQAHHATEEAKHKLPPNPTDDDFVRLGIEVTRKVEDLVRTSYKASSYHTADSDAGWYRYLNRLGLVKGLRWRLAVLLGQWKRLKTDAPGAVVLNVWLQEVYHAAQDHLRDYASEQERTFEGIVR